MKLRRRAQELALKPKAAPNGPKVIRSQHPTVNASAMPVQAAETKSECRRFR